MQRAICRFIRGSYRNFRENDCPAVATEEVRQKNKSKEDFTPPKRSVSETFLGWTTGLILTYEFHQQHRRKCFGRETPRSETNRINLCIQNCRLFAIAKHLVTQPVIGSLYSIQSVRPLSSLPVSPRKSIDQTPFLHEPEQFSLKDFKYLKQETSDENDDEEIYFDPTISKFDEVRAFNATKNTRGECLHAEKVTSELFSALGVFKFLTVPKEADATEKEAFTLEAMDILKKGAELGSSRALYNIGVAYDRQNETDLSKEYYRRAADLGHPLASYNLAVMSLKEGNLNEGICLMEYAAKNGVEEALQVMNGSTQNISGTIRPLA